MDASVGNAGVASLLRAEQPSSDLVASVRTTLRAEEDFKAGQTVCGSERREGCAGSPWAPDSHTTH